MPQAALQSKPKRRLFERLLRSFLPCIGKSEVLDDTSDTPPADKAQRERVSIATKAAKDAAPAQPQNMTEVDDPAHSVVMTISSNPCNNPCESVVRLSQYSHEPVNRPPSVDDCLPASHEPDSGPTTRASKVSVESIKDGNLLNPMPQAEGVLVFPNASGFRLDQFTYNEAPKTQGGAWFNPQGNEGWRMLLGRVVANALYNAGHQFQSPKCDEGTRVQVIGEIMSWLDNQKSQQPLLCVTGSSGAGKSALQQTIAEQCMKKNSPSAQLKHRLATFFFSKDDPSCNNASCVIPTIAYQLGLGDTALRNRISSTVADDPLLFTKSLKAQLDALVFNPISAVQSTVVEDRKSTQYIILVDAVNECADEGRQAELLTAIKDCLFESEYRCVRVILSSRIGWAISTTLAPRGNWWDWIYHIHFTMDSAVVDVSRMSWRRLEGNTADHRKDLRRVVPRPPRMVASATYPSNRRADAGSITPSVQQQHRVEKAGPRSESPVRVGRRSRSVPPTALTPLYIYPSPAQVIASLDLAYAAPTFTTPPQPYHPWYIPASQVAPDSTLWRAYLPFSHPDAEPESAATDGTANESYPPSPENTESAESPAALFGGSSEHTTARKSRRPDKQDFFPSLAIPNPSAPSARTREIHLIVLSTFRNYYPGVRTRRAPYFCLPRDRRLPPSSEILHETFLLKGVPVWMRLFHEGGGNSVATLFRRVLSTLQSQYQGRTPCKRRTRIELHEGRIRAPWRSHLWQGCPISWI
ncbi:hypothetical protein NMY22_g9446 [Coprinellus aureogranulatus]|nr:hypothetical protein NMY22_g9446 [Coprinellus aureogranulatus]